ncbi:hypothetical protein C8Q80DRAFT_81943 [Daedaleopsis nitida]|nr:hypothetical protein C8Q80DRAFT_81943 [Daedaleopsis nitida]
MTMTTAQRPMDVDSDHPPPALNYDILLAIMAVSRRPAVAQMMSTCSTLYHSGAQHLLRPPVAIVSDKQLTSFCFFMLARAKRTCFRYFRALILSTGLLHETTARDLVVILRRASHLESLVLLYTPDFLRSDPELADAIAGIQSLRHLEVHEVTGSACELLRAMRAPLVSLKLTFGYVLVEGVPEVFYESIDPDELPEYHPVALLTSVAPTLEALSVTYRNTAGTEMWGPAAPTVYPHLATLELQDEWPLMRPYIRAFPNVRALTIESNRAEYEAELGSMLEWFEENRQVNMEDQLVNARWDHLEEYSGAVIGLYLAGVACRIPRVKLLLVEDEHLDLLGPVLDDAKPVQLDVTVRGLLFDNTERSICTVLRRDGCASLTRLSLTVQVCIQDRDRLVQNSLDNLLAALQVLPLEYFELKLELSDDLDKIHRRPSLLTDEGHASEEVYVEYSPPLGYVPPLFPVEHSLEDLDPLVYGQRILAGVPALKRVSIEIEHPRNNPQRVLQLIRDDNREVVVFHDALK